MEKNGRYLDGKIGKNVAQPLPQEEAVACPHAQKVFPKFLPCLYHDQNFVANPLLLISCLR